MELEGGEKVLKSRFPLNRSRIRVISCLHCELFACTMKINLIKISEYYMKRTA